MNEKRKKYPPPFFSFYCLSPGTFGPHCVQYFLISRQFLGESRNSPHFLKPKASMPLVPIPSQTNPVHALSSCLLEINSNITLPCKPRSSKEPYSFRFPHQNSVHISLFHDATCLAHLILFDFRILLIVVRIINREAPHIFRPPLMSSNLCPNISFSILFFNTLSLCF